MEKTLYDCQQRTFDFFASRHDANKCTLDTSEVGTGKTIVAVKLASREAKKGHSVVVVCPKSVIPMWEKELAEEGVSPLAVVNYEKLRTGRTPWLSKVHKKVMNWQVPAKTFIIFDEVHYCKGFTSQNSRLLIAAVQQGFLCHCMSATAAEDPTEMLALGFAMGLHAFVNPKPKGLPGITAWLMRHGCTKDPWHNWQPPREPSRLIPIKEALYDGPDSRARKLLVSDFPDSFRDNLVFVENLDFGDRNKIHKAYSECGITPAIIDEIVDGGSIQHECLLVELLRARQLAESYKLHLIADMVEELRSENKSVVVFLNFRDSVAFLAESLGHHSPALIEGGQTASGREAHIQRFQDNKTRLALVNVSAGGTGVSLHDVHGDHPRVSLISPTFNAKHHIQVLGRIHRNGAKSDAVQKVLVASGTIEEDVMEAINKKIERMNHIV